MYKKIISLAVIVFNCASVWADTPGKATMHESKVTFQNVSSIQDYTFHYSFNYGDKAGIIRNDSALIIPASNGAPDGFIFWGTNNSNQKSTDTIIFRNYYTADAVVILSAVTKDSIRYSITPLSNANELVSERNTDSIANKQLITDARAAKRNHYIQTALLYGAGIAGLGGLVWFFVRRKKKKQVAV